MEASMARKVRKHGMISRFGGARPERKLSADEKRQNDKEKAEKEFPELLSVFRGIKDELKKNLAKGRFEYQKSLKKMYRLVWDWDAEGSLNEKQTAIARLRGVPLHPNANRFSGIVAICCDRDRKTVSRWSQDLDNAFEAEVAPQRLISFLKKEASSKTKKSKAKRSEAKKPKVKKPKGELRWGP
jgi:hypothetical protein